MVRLFLRDMTLLSIPIVIGIAVHVYRFREYFPAPRVTDNISLNDKLPIYKHEGSGPLEVVGVGSSMTLNNLNSRGVMEQLRPAEYLNFGSWGCGLRNTRDVVRMLVQHIHPKVVVVCAGIMEFSQEQPGYHLDTALVARFLWHDPEWLAYARVPQPSYYLRNMESNRIRYLDAGNYEHLHYDEHGGSSLDVPVDRRSKDRWEQKPPPANVMVDSMYAVVAGLGRYLQQEHVELIWMHSPLRAGLMTAEVKQRIATHLQRVRGILEPMGHVVVDTEDRIWPDSLYCDYSHFNGAGAYAFTSAALAKLPQGKRLH